MQVKRMTTKRLVTNALFIALYIILAHPAFAINTGYLKFTFAAFPILLCAMIFGPLDAVIVAGLGGLLQQLMTYGISVMMVLWIAPAMVQGLLVGLFARRHRYALTNTQAAVIIGIAGLVVTTLNTFVLLLDAKIFHHHIAFTLLTITLRYVNSLVMAAIHSLVIPRAIALIRRSNILD